MAYTVQTLSEFTVIIEEEALDDWELFEALNEVTSGNESMIVNCVKMLLGEAQTKLLKEHLRKKYGRVKASVMIADFFDLMEKIKDLKNSTRNVFPAEDSNSS